MAPETAPADRAERLQRWIDRTTPLVIGAAVLPLAGAFTQFNNDVVTTVVLLACWLVFLVDLIVHLRLVPHYLGTGWGRVDLGIVLLTFPWELLPFGPDAAGILVLARLARVGRVLVVATKGAPVLRRMYDRLGRAALYAAIAVFTAAWLVYLAERPNDGFETFGDALWWAIVTVTTVGYGDIVPTTTAARFAASVLMISGIALIGALAGTLASALGLAQEGEEADEEQVDSGDVEAGGATGEPAPAAASVSTAELHEEIGALRREVAELTALVRSQAGPGAG